MANITACDVCGKPGQRVQVAYMSMGVVVKDQPTATVFEQDLCDSCRPAAARALFERALTQQEAAIPIQKEVIAARERIADIDVELVTLVGARDANDAASQAWRNADMPVQKLVSERAALGQRVEDLLAQAA